LKLVIVPMKLSVAALGLLTNECSQHFLTIKVYGIMFTPVTSIYKPYVF
jgi:hypothetical protein